MSCTMTDDLMLLRIRLKYAEQEAIGRGDGSPQRRAEEEPRKRRRTLVEDLEGRE